MPRFISGILHAYRHAPFLDYQRAAFQLALFSITALALGMLSVQVAWFSPRSDPGFGAVLVGLLVLMIGLMELLRRGHARFTAHAYLFLIFSIITIDTVVRPGVLHVRMDNTALFIMTLTCVSMLTSARGTLIYAGMILAVFLGFVTMTPGMEQFPRLIFISYVTDSLVGIIATTVISLVFLDMTGRARQIAETLNTVLTKEVEIRRAELKGTREEVERANDSLIDANKNLSESRERILGEVRLAARLQRHAQPAEPPPLSGWDLSFAFEPLGEISGDFFDVYESEGRLEGIGLFDVSGHGVSSGLITVLARQAAAHHFRRGRRANLNLVAQALNAELIRGMDRTNYYLTGILLRVNEDALEFVNAGHPDLLLRRASGAVEVLDVPEEERGFMLGMRMLRCAYPVRRFRMEPGDSLLLYTDALTESASVLPSGAAELYDARRLKAALAAAPRDVGAEAELEYILNDQREFLGHRKYEDDLTAVIIKKT